MRKPVNKSRSARSFNRQSRRVKVPNMRGGIRL